MPNIWLILAVGLAIYVGFMVMKGKGKNRVPLLAAFACGLLFPKILGALSTVAGSATALPSSGGF